MRRRKPLAMIRHAAKMVMRTLKSYALLSVTIMLSFALFLGYLTYMDSTIYNKNKKLFAYRRGDITLCIPSDGVIDGRVSILLASLEKMEGTGYFLTHSYSLGAMSTTYQLQDDAYAEPLLLRNQGVRAIMIPDHAWIDGSPDPRPVYGQLNIVWHDGQERTDFTLEKDQVLLTEPLYFALGMDQATNPVFHLRCILGQHIDLKVMGYVKDWSREYWADANYEISLYLSTKFVEYARLNDPTCWQGYGGFAPNHYSFNVNIYSENPEKVVQMLENMNYTDANYDAIYLLQNEALEEIQDKKAIKAVIACALLLLLGINLYSSFTNAMNDRKYEIGVKRAIGAGGWSVIRQFLYESLLVMVANIGISIAIVVDAGIIYKYVMEHIPEEMGGYEEFVLYISPHSIGMFAVCAITLTVVFSLIFAYKSSQVEIVQYLKGE